MRTPEGPRDQQVRIALEREVGLLDSAVRLVAAGRSPAVTVAGLHLATAAIALVTPIAADLGVVLEPLWGSGDVVTDVRIVRQA